MASKEEKKKRKKKEKKEKKKNKEKRREKSKTVKDREDRDARMSDGASEQSSSGNESHSGSIASASPVPGSKRKAPALENGTLSAKLKVKGSLDDIGGVIASFPNGPPPRRVLDASCPEEGQFHFRCYQNVESRRKKQRILRAQTEKMRYEGRNFGPEVGKGNELSRLVVGVYNKEKQEVSLYTVPHVFTMSQSVRGTSTSFSQDGTHKALSGAERHRLLIDSFGSKKKQRAVKSAEANKVQAGHVAAANTVERLLYNKVEQVAGESQATDASEASNREKLLPPMDANATEQSKVYKYREFITDEEWENVTTRSEAVLEEVKESGLQEYLKAKREAGFRYSNFAYQQLKRLAGTGDDKDHIKSSSKNKQKLALILYTNDLISFYRMRTPLRKTVGEMAEDLQCSPSSVQHFVQAFTQTHVDQDGKVSFQRPDFCTDKLCMHLLVFALVAGDYAINPEVLGSDLKIPQKKCLQYFREIGCKIETRKKTKEEAEKGMYRGGWANAITARLMAPPQFPKIRRAKAPQR